MRKGIAMQREINKGEALRYLNDRAEEIWGFVYEAKDDILLSRKHILKGPGWEGLLEGADKIYITKDIPPVVTVYRGNIEYVMIVIYKNICSNFR